MAKTVRTKSQKNDSRSIFGRIIKKLKANKRITITVSIIIFAVVGGLFVHFSQAAIGATWTAKNISIIRGKYTTKADGRIAVQSIAHPSGVQTVQAYVKSSVSNNDTYCFYGKSTKATSIWTIGYSYGNFTTPGFSYGTEGYKMVAAGNPPSGVTKGPTIPAGDFLVCGKVPGRPSNAYPGKSRNIEFFAQVPGDGLIAVYQVGRTGY